LYFADRGTFIVSEEGLLVIKYFADRYIYAWIDLTLHKYDVFI